jgi:hypothetical protein
MIIVPPVHSSASPTALELAQRIANAIAEYRQTHPGVSSTDIREAMRIAAASTGADGNRRFAIIAAVAVAMLVAAGLLSTLGRMGHTHAPATVWPAIGIAAVAAVLVLLIKARR